MDFRPCCNITSSAGEKNADACKKNGKKEADSATAVSAFESHVICIFKLVKPDSCSSSDKRYLILLYSSESNILIRVLLITNGDLRTQTNTNDAPLV